MRIRPSVLQASQQSITAMARKFKGNIVFLGGPMYFLSNCKSLYVWEAATSLRGPKMPVVAKAAAMQAGDCQILLWMKRVDTRKARDFTKMLHVPPLCQSRREKSLLNATSNCPEHPIQK